MVHNQFARASTAYAKTSTSPRKQAQATSKVASTDTRSPTKPGSAQDKLIKLEQQIRACADWTVPAIDARATYARVREPAEIRGFWRLDGYKTACLQNAYPRITHTIRPHSESRRPYSTLDVHLTNRQGETKTIKVTDESIVTGELSSKLTAFCISPELDTQRRHLMEAYRLLAREGEVQEQAETLGWNTRQDGTLVWIMANGCETETGFLPSAQSPYVAPDIPVGGNGYYGADVPMPTPDTPDCLIGLLSHYVECEQARVIIASLLGLAGVVMIPSDVLPEGLALEDGTLRFSPDLVGPPRHGKNRTLNTILSLFGTRFKWNTQPLLSIDRGSKDTGIGRNELMSIMRYHLYADADHKAAPDNPDFAEQHSTRKGAISMFADGPTGGATGRRTGGLRARAIPRGGNIRTCNHDHAPYSIEHQEDMIEARACTFVWPEGIVGGYQVSVALDKHRLELYAYGQAYRRWIMRQWRENKEAFRERVALWFDLANTLVNDEEWAYDHHRNQAEVIVLGLFMWQQFIEDCYPQHVLYRWIEERITPVLDARVERSSYIKHLVAQHTERMSVENFTLDAIRYLLSSHQIYIRNQRNEALKEADVAGLPFTIGDAGYRSTIRTIDGVDTETWDSGNKAIGYLVHKRQDIAFKTALLMEELRREADRRNIPLGTHVHILATLVKKGVVLPDVDATGKFRQNEQVIKLVGKTERLLVIPVSTLFTSMEDADEQEREDTDTTTRPQAYCPHCERMLWVHHVIGDMVMWVCGKCSTPYDPETALLLEDETPSKVISIASARPRPLAQEEAQLVAVGASVADSSPVSDHYSTDMEVFNTVFEES
jgi:hypothetical protein